MTDIIILLPCRQLQIYSARHCGSFAKQVQTEKLKHVEHLIGGCHDDLTCYLVQCFNQPAVSSCLVCRHQVKTPFFQIFENIAEKQ